MRGDDEVGLYILEVGLKYGVDGDIVLFRQLAHTLYDPFFVPAGQNPNGV